MIMIDASVSSIIAASVRYTYCWRSRISLAYARRIQRTPIISIMSAQHIQRMRQIRPHVCIFLSAVPHSLIFLHTHIFSTALVWVARVWVCQPRTPSPIPIYSMKKRFYCATQHLIIKWCHATTRERSERKKRRKHSKKIMHTHTLRPGTERKTKSTTPKTKKKNKK